MDRYQPLNCDLYDYLEIACMHGYRLKVELVNGQIFEGTPLTTRTASSKEEFLQFADGIEEVRMDQLAAITPLDDGASFGRVELGNSFCST
ncbi:Rho-binding antiterminator [Pseudomonas sp. LS-2]|jgi:Rho-binding antiterminator|uniref:Rho-binding antiterminator n=1 Tax=Pseudomonas sp. LS-2 TaxID=2315859 RepID=UPI000E70B0A6|nr:Rho-binding antiterminator [Pseudomonas sp. LS-2]RJX74676.1 transcriptional antiterminator [Pseudomonas sp. LS-2]